MDRELVAILGGLLQIAEKARFDPSQHPRHPKGWKAGGKFSRKPRRFEEEPFAPFFGYLSRTPEKVQLTPDEQGQVQALQAEIARKPRFAIRVRYLRRVTFEHWSRLRSEIEYGGSVQTRRELLRELDRVTHLLSVYDHALSSARR